MKTTSGRKIKQKQHHTIHIYKIHKFRTEHFTKTKHNYIAILVLVFI